MDLPTSVNGVSSFDLTGGSSGAPRNVVEWPERLLKAPLADPFWSGSTSQDVPVVVDFGSHKIRAGFSNQTDPFLDFPSVYSRYRWGLPLSDDEDSVGMQTFVGNDTLLLPPGTKKNSVFDLNVIYHYDAVEYMFDHIFSHLLNHNIPTPSLDMPIHDDQSDDESDDELMPKAKRRKLTSHSNENSKKNQKSIGSTTQFYDQTIGHPVLLTEAPLNPKTLRNQLTQILFECYGAPKLAFGIDALFSLLYDHHHNYVGSRVTNCFDSSYTNNKNLKNPSKMFDFKIGSQGLEVRSPDDLDSSSLIYPDNALVVSSGFETTHLLPVLNGELDVSNVSRISVGGHHGTDLLNKSVLFRYSEHKNVWGKMLPSYGPTLGYAASEAVKEQECFTALPDYHTSLKSIQEYFVSQGSGSGLDRLNNYANDTKTGENQETNKNSIECYLQLPYDPAPMLTISEEERIEREAKRLANAERMREMMKKRKAEKMLEKQKRLDQLEQLFEARMNLDSNTFHEMLAAANFDESDWPTAALGGPRDRVVQEISEIKKYLDRAIDESIQMDKSAQGSQPSGKTPILTLEEKLQVLDLKFPLTAKNESELTEEELINRKLEMKLRKLSEGRIRKSHEREIEKRNREELKRAANSVQFNKSTGEDSKDMDQTEDDSRTVIIDLDMEEEQKETVEITIDENTDLSMMSLDELQTQRKAIWTKLQKITAVHRDNTIALKKATEEANKATVSDLANLGQELNRPTGPSSASGTGINGVGSIANAIGNRLSRAKKNTISVYAAAADENLDYDDDELEQVAFHGRSITLKNPAEVASIAAGQASFMAQSKFDSSLKLLNDEKQLLAKVDDEILGRLEPSLLRQREAENHQVCLSVDRIRSPELIFQPSLIGNEQQGLIEAIHSLCLRTDILPSSNKRNGTGIFVRPQNSRSLDLMQRVFLTGGNCSFRGISPRVFLGVAPDMPVDAKIQVIQASNPTLNAWKGASLFANNQYNISNHFVDIGSYNEEGGDRIQELMMRHFAANRNQY